jgi:hypothetical protein
MSPRCFQVHPADNVATLLDELPRAPLNVRVLGPVPGEVVAMQPIPQSHKVALRDIDQGQPVIKFGVVIGHASRNVRAGEWLHLHNCASNFDERSQTLDLRSGVPTDTRYE